MSTAKLQRRVLYLRLNTYIIDTHIEDDSLVSFAAFIFFKSKYQNSSFYDFNYSDAARKTGLGRSVVKKHVDFFVEKGWCDWIGKNLLFKNINDTAPGPKKKYQLTYEFKGTIKQIYRQLVAMLFKRKKQQQEWLRKENCQQGSVTPEYFLSYSTIASTIKCSPSTAYRIFRELIKEGVVKCKRKAMGFLREYASLFRDLNFPANKNSTIKGKMVLCKRPSISNWVNFAEYVFPNSYSF